MLSCEPLHVGTQKVITQIKIIKEYIGIFKQFKTSSGETYRYFNR